MLLPCLLKILEKSESVREGCMCVSERESERAGDRESCGKRWICAACHCVWNTTVPLLVLSDSSWDRSTHRLEEILHERSFICACYVCATWISVLCISLTHGEEADVVKLHSGKHDCCAVCCCRCCFPILLSFPCLLAEADSYHRETVELQREHHGTQTEMKKHFLSLLMPAVQTAILQFCYQWQNFTSVYVD